MGMMSKGLGENLNENVLVSLVRFLSPKCTSAPCEFVLV